MKTCRSCLVLTSLSAVQNAPLPEYIKVMGQQEPKLEQFYQIVGKDIKMQVVYDLIREVANTNTTVFIQGESGTGKEIVARAIHKESHRKKGPFVVINCGAYPETLMESELFGHEKGAFTGAIRRKAGRFEQAHHGTVFLDEIGEISPAAQIKLLRVLQTRSLKRLGGEKIVYVDVRIVTATNKDLVQEVKNGNFREDLYYRLNVIPIMLPPLRKRNNDIPLLAKHFLQRFASEQGKKLKEFDSEAMRALMNYSWPGNVRELENCIEHASVLAKNNRIEVFDLPSPVINNTPGSRTAAYETLPENEKRLLISVLEESVWNKKLSAQRLGISRSTLYAKLKKHGIRNPSKS